MPGSVFHLRSHEPSYAGSATWGVGMALFLITVSLWGQNPIPFVTQPLTPSSAAPGMSGLTLSVRGAAFVSGATVYWNGAPLATAFDSQGQISAAVPASALTGPTTALVSVANPGARAISGAVPFPIGAADNSVFYADSPSDPITAVPFAIGNFYGSGRTEVLAAGGFSGGQPGYIQLFLPDSSGNMSGGPETALPAGADGMGVGDFNGDGKLDVLTVDQHGNVVVLLGTGDGTFAVGPPSPLAMPPLAFEVKIADFNRDGNLDFLGEEGVGGPIQVFFGKGDGTFQAGPTTLLPPAVNGQGQFSLIDGGIGDLNRDGNLDLVISDGYNVWAMLGRGDGTFALAPGSPVNAGVVGNSVAVADFNADGNEDLAVPSCGASDKPTITVLLGRGDGTFAAVPSCCGTPEPLMHCLDIAAGDFTNQGHLDLAVNIQDLQSTTPASYMEIMLGHGDGTFTPSSFSELLPTLVNALWTADFNGDGKLDFLVRLYQVGDGWAMIQQPPSSEADFTLTPADSTLTVLQGATATTGIEIASVGGFLGALSPIRCAGAPPLATCTVQQPPNELIPTAKATLQLTVSTKAPDLQQTGLRAPVGGNAGRLAGFGLLVIAVLLSGIPRTKRVPPKRGGLAAGVRLVLLAAGIAFLVGCGAASQPWHKGGTPPGAYTLVVSATSAGITHSATVNVIVQPAQ